MLSTSPGLTRPRVDALRAALARKRRLLEGLHELIARTRAAEGGDLGRNEEHLARLHERVVVIEAEARDLEARLA